MKKLICLLAVPLALYSCGNGAETTEQLPPQDSTAANESIADCDNPAVSAKVQKAYLLQTVNDYTSEEAQNWLDEYERGTLPIQGLTAFETDTTYYGHCIIGISYRLDWMGAYPSSHIGYINYNLKTGDTLYATDFIANDKINDLIAMCNTKLQQQIADSRKALVADFNSGHNELENYLEDVDNYLEQHPPGFTLDNIGNYKISNDGVIWVYEFGFPHYMQALEPDHDIKITKDELRPLLNPNGPLGFLIR